MEISDSFIDVPGGRIFCRHWCTSGARSPIVLLHDSLGCVDLWRDFPEELATATGRDVIAYDRLGFGRSTRRDCLPSHDFVSEEASVFRAIKHSLGMDRFCLFGHSVGGAMALVIAAQGDSCEAVITESAQAFVEPRTLSGIRAAKAAFGDSGQFAKIARWHGDKARWVLDAWTEVWLSPEFLDWNLDHYLGRIECPVLAIHGELDEYGSEEFPRRITRLVGRSSELAILEQCGHVPHRERKDDVMRLVTSFLQRQVT